MKILDKAKCLAAGLVVKMKADRRLELSIYAGLMALCILLCLPSCGEKKRQTVQNTENAAYSYDAADMEARLMKTLSCIRGAGSVQVMITYDTGPEIVPATRRDVQVSTGGASSESRAESQEPVTVYQNGEDAAIVLTERMPTVRGVIVVAEGAADISVKLKLQSAVQAALGVEAARVEVFEMGLKGMEEEQK